MPGFAVSVTCKNRGRCGMSEKKYRSGAGIFLLRMNLRKHLFADVPREGGAEVKTARAGVGLFTVLIDVRY